MSMQNVALSAQHMQLLQAGLLDPNDDYPILHPLHSTQFGNPSPHAGLSTLLALAFQHHKAKLGRRLSRSIDGAVNILRGYVLCQLVAAKDVKLALELLAAFPERNMLALPPTDDMCVYAIDNAVRAQRAAAETMLQRDLSKSSKGATDTAAFNRSLTMVRLLHEFRNDGCTYRAFNCREGARIPGYLAFLNRNLPQDRHCTGPLKRDPADGCAIQ
ncbi:hypothetical protein SPRG_09423 [Saprolegnia parasitica CBS 223.65]|uniref:Uncharacterized protein n=1 Tax=Saprolegnia parasitica (strain CBS 223.65) TaxID=695850 RepID=A0A067C8I7_SAPPC|nr:hypothetical protein SPRG_09423 [Saprolegnia parasitica CBS 223.65]KDO25480.1 hypothetical protein SPRG_09423 [Saprolegnia parasitica CBS 223.65]|eukprot:XP_012203905.1 hypothetical protein SPRG_09423 [Saprolegnia parasitica CBS 223.65]